MTEDGALSVKVMGPITGESKFEKAKQFINSQGAGANQIRFDMAEVTRFNSEGVREWLVFMDGLTFSGKIRFANLGAFLVEQVMAIPVIL